jgi:hypothetical protein
MAAKKEENVETTETKPIPTAPILECLSNDIDMRERTLQKLNKDNPDWVYGSVTKQTAENNKRLMEYRGQELVYETVNGEKVPMRIPPEDYVGRTHKSIWNKIREAGEEESYRRAQTVGSREKDVEVQKGSGPRDGNAMYENDSEPMRCVPRDKRKTN